MINVFKKVDGWCFEMVVIQKHCIILTNGQKELVDIDGRLGRRLHEKQASVFSIGLGVLLHENK